MRFEELTNKKIAILWFGKEGKSTLTFLQNLGCEDITVLDKTDISPPSSLLFAFSPQSFGIKRESKIQFITWDNYLDNLETYDYIFKSPWISPYTNNLLKYKDKIRSQAKLFFELYKWKIISVTQTKWKSTTATLVYELLKNAWYKVKFVWNIWNPVLDDIDLGDNHDFVVYELSSYMLEDLDNHHSFISIFWNLFPDHLDWHQGFENYKSAKLNILKDAKNLLVGENLSKEITSDLKEKNYKTFWLENSYYSHIWSDFFVDWEKLQEEIKPLIPWEHNLSNICAILWVCDILKIDFNVLGKTINSFSWLPHRLQNIWIYNWITFIDDAISTTPESTIEWIKSFTQKIWTIFLWWSDRWYNFENLVKELENNNIYNIVLFPDSWVRIKELLDDKFNAFETKSMKEAVDFAFKYTKSWEICLLSTASPSYSLWKNFEAKWNEFQREIRNKEKE